MNALRPAATEDIGIAAAVLASKKVRMRTLSAEASLL